jgi:hypothetical protein
VGAAREFPPAILPAIAPSTGDLTLDANAIGQSQNQFLSGSGDITHQSGAVRNPTLPSGVGCSPYFFDRDMLNQALQRRSGRWTV